MMDRTVQPDGPPDAAALRIKARKYEYFYWHTAVIAGDGGRVWAKATADLLRELLAVLPAASQQPPDAALRIRAGANVKDIIKWLELESDTDAYDLLCRARDTLRDLLAVLPAAPAPLERKPCPTYMDVWRVGNGEWLKIPDGAVCPRCGFTKAEHAAAPAPEAGAECVWTEDDDGTYHTSCKNAFQFNDGGPAENKVRFCGYCGRKLVAAGVLSRPEGAA